MALKWMAVCAFALMATAVCSAQHRFPLRSGEWETATPSAMPGEKPIAMLYCLNDELWEKAFTQDPSCSIKEFNLSSTGASYFMDCNMKILQMKGKVTLAFDGMQHMIGKAVLDATVNGKTTNSVTTTDWRWKSPTCSPNDMNLKPARTH